MSDVLFRPYNAEPEQERSEPLVFTPAAQPQYGPARWPEGPAEYRRGTRPPVNIEDLPPPDQAIFTPAVQPGGTNREQRNAFARLAEFLGLRNREPGTGGGGRNTIEMQGPGIGTAAEALFTAGEDLFMQVANAGPARISEDYSLRDKLRDTGNIARELFNVTRFGDETPYETPYPEATPAERLFSGMIDPTDAARLLTSIPVFRQLGNRATVLGEITDEITQLKAGRNPNNLTAEEINNLEEEIQDITLRLTERELMMSDPNQIDPVAANNIANDAYNQAEEDLMEALQRAGLTWDDAEEILYRFDESGRLSTPLVKQGRDLWTNLRLDPNILRTSNLTGGRNPLELFKGYTGKWANQTVPVGTNDPLSLTEEFVNDAVRYYDPDVAASGATAWNYVLNGFLRNRDELMSQHPQSAERMQQWVEEMDKVFTFPEAIVTEPTTVYRGLVMDPSWLPNQSIEEMVGKTIRDEGFSSFSEKADIAMSFMGGHRRKYDPNKIYVYLVTDIPENGRAVSIAPLSEIPNEQEILFPRNTMFRINQVTPRTTDWGVTYYIVNATPDYSRAAGIPQVGQ